MIQRDRAWRRRTEKLVLHREDEARDASPRTIDPSARPAKELKQHRHGALTHVQAMRLEGALGQEMREALDPT